MKVRVKETLWFSFICPQCDAECFNQAPIGSRISEVTCHSCKMVLKRNRKTKAWEPVKPIDKGPEAKWRKRNDAYLRKHSPGFLEAVQKFQKLSAAARGN